MAAAAKFWGLAILFPFCLAATCLSERAAAWTQTVTGNQGAQLVNGTWVSYTKTPYGPGTGGGGGGIPGLCGLLGLSGTFGNATVAQIIDQDGLYTLYRKPSKNSKNSHYWVTATLTCQALADFKIMLPASEWSVVQTKTFMASHGASTGQKQITGSTPQYACIWAGVAGNLSAPRGPQGGPNIVWVQVNSTTMNSQYQVQSTPTSTLSTNAWCSGFTTPGWQWTYTPFTSIQMPNAPISPGTLVALFPPVIENTNWCYMAGVGTPGGPFSFVFGSIGGNYAANISKDAALLWNCLPLKQGS